MDDVLYLKDGSIIRGMIIEQVPNENLKIKTKDGNVYAYSFEQISRITKEASNKNQNIRISGTSQRNDSVSIFRSVLYLNYFHGVGNITGVYDSGSSGSSGIADFSNNSKLLRIETINGANFASGFLSAGIGLGLDFYIVPFSDPTFTGNRFNNEVRGNIQMPVFFDFRVYPLQNIEDLHIVIQAGYSIGIKPIGISGPISSTGFVQSFPEQKFRLNGVQYGFGIGTKIAQLKDRKLLLFTGIEIQQFKYELTSDTNWGGQYINSRKIRYEIDTNTFRLGVGFEL